MKDNSFKLVKEWIIKGQNDFKAARILYREKGPSDTLCFHCHQSVEKYLKAYLVFHAVPFEKIHDLWQLAKRCAQRDKSFLKFRNELQRLDAYYIESRYPPEIVVYSRQECKEALEATEHLTQFIVDKIFNHL